MKGDPDAPRSEVSLGEIAAVLRRRKFLVILNVAIFLAAGVLYCLVVTPFYRSTTRILVEGRTQNNQTPATEDPISNVTLSTTSDIDVPTQMEVIQSFSLLGRVCERLRIPLPRDETQDLPIVVTAKEVATTNVIEVNIDAIDPKWSVQLADALPKEYSDYMKESRQSEAKKALAFLRERLNQENQGLRESERKLKEFKATHHVMDLLPETSQRTEKATKTELDKTAVDRQLEGAKARLRAALAARQAIPPTVDATSVQSNALQIDAQKKVIADLEAQRAQMLSSYLPTSSAIAKIDAQIKVERDYLGKIPKTQIVRSQIRNPAIESYDGRIADAREALNDLEAETGHASRDVAATRSDQAKYASIQEEQAALQRDVDEGSAAVARLGKSADDVAVRSQAIKDPVVSMSPPTLPLMVKPRWVLTLVLAMFVGFVFGTGLAFLRDRADPRVTSTGQADNMVGALGIGYVPIIKNGHTPALTGGGYASDGSALPVVAPNTDDLVLECYRIMRSNFDFSTAAEPVRSMMVTSTNAREGKSFVAMNFANALAADGRRVILVDANLRRPSVHEKLDLNQSPGLGDILAGDATLEQALQPTLIPGLSVVAAGGATAGTAELIASEGMRKLHAELCEACDVVVYDAPSSVRPADAQVLSSIVDGVLYVVQLGVPRTDDMRYGIHLLRNARARILGIVYNRVPVTPHEAPRV